MHLHADRRKRHFEPGALRPPFPLQGTPDAGQARAVQELLRELPQREGQSCMVGPAAACRRLCRLPPPPHVVSHPPPSAVHPLHPFLPFRRCPSALWPSFPASWWTLAWCTWSEGEQAQQGQLQVPQLGPISWSR